MNSSIYLGRQPILGRNEQLCGYELLFRSAKVPNMALVHDDSAATATVITYAFSELSLGQALNDKKVFVNIGEEFLFSSLLEFLNPEQVVLEILETIEITPSVVERCRLLKQLGFTLALDDVLEITPAIRALLPLVDIVKFILMRDWEKQAERIVHDLQGFPVRLLAERVETPEQFKKCAALGFSLFQGYFFAYPTVLHGRKLGQDRSILVTLLNQILNDVDTKVLEKTFKSAPGLSVNLLRLTNSVAFGGHAQIISLGHAITILGRQQLRRWLQLLLFSSSDNRKQLADNPLLHLAATRAYLMEKLVLTQKIGGPIVAEQAFLIGIMSLVPVILDMSMEEILEQLSNLPSSIHDALLKHDGRLGKLLLLVKNLEKDDPSEGDFSTHLFGFPGLKLSVLNSLHCEALAWASQLGQPMNSGLPRNRTLNPDYA